MGGGAGQAAVGQAGVGAAAVGPSVVMVLGAQGESVLAGV